MNHCTWIIFTFLMPKTQAFMKWLIKCSTFTLNNYNFRRKLERKNLGDSWEVTTFFFLPFLSLASLRSKIPFRQLI
jgi:hypothetical protein